jgi:hypothetical protein
MLLFTIHPYFYETDSSEDPKEAFDVLLEVYRPNFLVKRLTTATRFKKNYRTE